MAPQTPHVRLAPASPGRSSTACVDCEPTLSSAGGAIGDAARIFFFREHRPQHRGTCAFLRLAPGFAGAVLYGLRRLRADSIIGRRRDRRRGEDLLLSRTPPAASGHVRLPASRPGLRRGGPLRSASTASRDSIIALAA